MGERDPLPFTVTKGQLMALHNAIDGTDLQEVRLTSVDVQGKRGILASYTQVDQYGEERRKILVIGDGVVKL